MEIVGCLSVSMETLVESSLTRQFLLNRMPSNGLDCVYLFQRERALDEPLASNGLPLWLQAVLIETLPSNSHIRHNIINM
jgi:hypothetical protein